MKWHDCISYARSHRVESGVGAWYCYSPFLGECVVSPKMGPHPKSRLTVVSNNNKYKSRVFGRSKMG